MGNQKSSATEKVSVICQETTRDSEAVNLDIRKRIQACNKVRQKFKKSHKIWVENRRQTIQLIRNSASELDEHTQNIRIAKLSGSVGGIAGGVLILAGLITMPFTLGATTSLLIAGFAVAVPSALTTVGATGIDIYINKKKAKRIKTLMEKDEELTKELHALVEEFEKLYRDLEQHPEFSKNKDFLSCAQGIGFTVGSLVKLIQLARLGRLGLMTDVLSIMNPVPFLKLDDAVEVGVTATRVSRVALSLSIALSAVGLAMDVGNMAYQSKKIHEYRMRRYQQTNNQNQLGAANVAESEELRWEVVEAETKTKGEDTEPQMTEEEQKSFLQRMFADAAEELRKYAQKLEDNLQGIENNAAIQVLIAE